MPHFIFPPTREQASIRHKIPLLGDLSIKDVVVFYFFFFDFVSSFEIRISNLASGVPKYCSPRMDIRFSAQISKCLN